MCQVTMWIAQEDKSKIDRPEQESYGESAGENMYGYPTIRNIEIAPSEKYLCVSHRTEKRWVQPLRLLAGIVGGPLIMSAALDVPNPRKAQAVFAAGLGMSLWSLAIHHYANREMNG